MTPRKVRQPAAVVGCMTCRDMSGRVRGSRSSMYSTSEGMATASKVRLVNAYASDCTTTAYAA
jgi:hypothetical protein